MMTGSKDTMKAYLSLLVVFFCWGSVYVANRYVLNSLTAPELACCRFLVSSAVLGGMLLGQRGHLPKIDRKDRAAFLFIGFMGYYLSMECTLLSVQYAGASLGSLINSLNPVFITIFAAIFLKEQLTVRKILCLVLAMIGVLIVTGGADGAGNVPGVLYGLGSILAWVVCVVSIRKLSARYPAMLITFLGITLSLIFHIPTASFELVNNGLPQVSLLTFLCILYSGVFGTAIPQFLWNYSLSKLPASTCSMFYPLMPVFSAILGAALLGEKLTGRFFAGGALIAATVIVSSIPHDRHKASS
ncbi:MAG: DMT family transporter [Lachnospiraceae bacterium]|nr:DMT family transporter [Lachnospiraceae bacterium]